MPEKFGVVVWGGFQVTTVSNLNEVDFELLWVELSWVTLGVDNNDIEKMQCEGGIEMISQQR